MAYRRTSVFRTPLMHWEQLTLVSTDGAWNDGYRVDSPRLLLPLSACFECRLDGRNFVCDPSTALWLTPDETYGMKHRVVGQHSTLLCIDTDLGRSRRAALPLAAHLRLGQWRHAVAQSSTEPLA